MLTAAFIAGVCVVPCPAVLILFFTSGALPACHLFPAAGRMLLLLDRDRRCHGRTMAYDKEVGGKSHQQKKRLVLYGSESPHCQGKGRKELENKMVKVAMPPYQRLIRIKRSYPTNPQHNTSPLIQTGQRT